MFITTNPPLKMQPFSPHNRFFSSLNQLQNRLSSESQSKTQTPQPPPDSNPSLSSSSSSPLYITTPKTPHQPTSTSSSSGPPLDFLSDPSTTQHQETDDGGVDDIETLMGLLGLPVASSPETSASCACDCSGGGFYKNVAGVEGPRCERERGRLDGWIDLYRRERAEPARLAHLMIGKAVALSRDCGGGGFDGVGFPATVEEFLERDP